MTIDEERRFVRSRFADGLELMAAPQYREEDEARAKALGYEGEDVVWQMTRDHDVMHHLLAASAGKESVALRGAVTGKSFGQAAHEEECMVFLLQRIANVGLLCLLAQKEVQIVDDALSDDHHTPTTQAEAERP